MFNIAPLLINRWRVKISFSTSFHSKPDILQIYQGLTLALHITTVKGMKSNQSVYVSFIFLYSSNHSSSIHLIRVSCYASTQTTRSSCKLDSDWCVTGTDLPSASPGWDPERTVRPARPWSTRNCTCWQSNGRCRGHHCTRWREWHGNPRDKNRETPMTDRLLLHLRLCAEQQTQKWPSYM